MFEIIGLLVAGGAAMGLHASFELRTRAGIPKLGPLPDDMSRTLKHAYLACVSYVDAQIGMLLGELRESGKLDSTVIVLWSDHGWQLGEHGMWDKHSNFETSTRAPLIVRVPGKNPGTSSNVINVRGSTSRATRAASRSGSRSASA